MTFKVTGLTFECSAKLQIKNPATSRMSQTDSAFFTEP